VISMAEFETYLKKKFGPQAVAYEQAEFLSIDDSLGSMASR
jgi:hypothetical protein